MDTAPLHLSALLDFFLERAIIRGVASVTPAEIAKLTEQAKRGKALMARSSTAATRSLTVFDNYEATLARFEAGVDQVDSQEKALAAQLMAMGNAGPILDATFSDGKTEIPPTEAAPTVNGTGGTAPSPLAQAKPAA